MKATHLSKADRNLLEIKLQLLNIAKLTTVQVISLCQNNKLTGHQAFILV